MTKTYQLTGPTDADSRKKLVSELQDVQGVHDVDVFEEADSPNSLSIALSGLGFTDEQVDDAAGAAGYALKLS